MARRGRITVFNLQPEPDPRSVGGLLFADPSTAGMTRDVHTYNEPRSHTSNGENNGFRSLTGSMVSWRDRTGATTTGDAYSAMNRKRGVLDADKEK